MARLKIFITEQTNANVIVVDVQPAYKKFIHFKIWEFCNFLNKQRNILYLYNGESMGMDGKQDIMMFLLENDLHEEKLNFFKFVDKGYAFLRGWMDSGIDDDDIIAALRYMDKRNVNDSRDIPVDKWIEIIPDLEDYSHIIADEPIYFPDIAVTELKRWNGAYICGGSETECLKEVEILLEAFNIRTKRINSFVY